MKKHLLFALLLLAIPLQAVVYSGGCGKNNNDMSVQWQLDTQDSILHITGNGPMNDYTFDTRAPWNPYKDNIRRVLFAETVTRSGNYAFDAHYSIDSVYFGGVQSVGYYGFCNCNQLRSAIIPHAVRIEQRAFESCYGLLRFISGNQLLQVHSRAFATGGNLRLVYLGNNVDSIAEQAFIDQSNLDSVYLGQHLRYIKEYAFRNSAQLRHVVFPSTLEELQYDCFLGSGLMELHIPAATREISSSAFRNCGSLLAITVDPANTAFDSRGNCNAICRKDNLTIVRGCQNTQIPATITTLGDYSFSSCGFTHLIIPSSITTLGRWVFEASGLVSVNFPNSITSCGDAPFVSCGGLPTPLYNNKYFAFLPYNYSGSYTLPQGPSEIVGGAISDRDQLTAVYIPDGYTNMGGGVFEYCDRLDTVSIGEGLLSLPGSMFAECRRLTGVHLPSTLERIEYHSFRECESLARVTIPDAVKVIGTESFRNCSSLQYVSIPAALESFENWWNTSCFMGCTSLSHVYWNARSAADHTTAQAAPFYDIRGQIRQFELGDSVTYVPNYLCYEMTALKSISIGKNVRKIGTLTDIESFNNVFYHCDSVQTITWNARSVVNPIIYEFSPFYTFRDNIRIFTFGDSVRIIPSYLCFGMDKITRLQIPEKVMSIGDYAFRMMPMLDTIVVASANPYYDSRNNCNAIIDKSTNELLVGCAKTTIPASVVSLASGAFRNVNRLTSLSVPNSVLSIGIEAFNGCTALTTIGLPSQLTKIQDYTFQDCSQLTSLVLPSSLTQIGIRAFSGCSSLQNLSIPVPVNLIDKEAFANTHMKLLSMQGTTPPTITTTSLPDACPISIPCAGWQAYTSHPLWGALGNRLSSQYQYAITASPNNTLWGTVSFVRSTCDEVSVTATPATGFEFVEWQDTNGQRVSIANPYTFSLTSNTSLIAFFQAKRASSSAISVEIHERVVTVNSDQPIDWRLFDTTGHPVDAASGETVSLQAPTGGIYILKSTAETHKIILQ